jgi:hypothetical protein
MSDESKIKYVTGGTSFLSLLTILFIHHKLVGTIAWSWWWVLSPIWIPVAIGLAAVIIAAAIGFYLSKR